MRKILALSLLLVLAVLPTRATLVSIGGTVSYPSVLANLAVSNLGQSACLIDAAAEACASIMYVPVTGSITTVEFLIGTHTTNDTLACAIQTVSATTGAPTGTDYGGSAAGSLAVTATGWKVCTLGTAATTATAGDLVALVITNGAVPGVTNIQRWTTGAPLGEQGPVYSALFQAGAWAFSGGWPIMTVSYAGVYHPTPGVLPATTIANTAYNTGAANDEGGNNVIPTFKCRVVGAWWYGSVVGGLTVKLYDTDGTTTLATVAVDKDQQVATSNGAHYVRFSSAITLSAAGTYKITILAAGASSEILYDSTLNSAAMMDTWSGGQHVYYTTRDGAGAWTNTTTRRAMMGLLIDQVDDGTGVAVTKKNFFVQ